jgi:hypothetical protein
LMLVHLATASVAFGWHAPVVLFEYLAR